MLFRERNYYKEVPKKFYTVVYVSRGGRWLKYRTQTTDRIAARKECIHYLGVAAKDIIEVYSDETGPEF